MEKVVAFERRNGGVTRAKIGRLEGLLKVLEQGERWPMVIIAHSARGGRVKQRLTRRQSRWRVPASVIL